MHEFLKCSWLIPASGYLRAGVPKVFVHGGRRAWLVGIRGPQNPKLVLFHYNIYYDKKAYLILTM